MVARRDAGRAERVPRQLVPGTGSQAVGPAPHIRGELRNEGGPAGQGLRSSAHGWQQFLKTRERGRRPDAAPASLARGAPGAPGHRAFALCCPAFDPGHSCPGSRLGFTWRGEGGPREDVGGPRYAPRSDSRRTPGIPRSHLSAWPSGWCWTSSFCSDTVCLSRGHAEGHGESPGDVPALHGGGRASRPSP